MNKVNKVKLLYIDLFCGAGGTSTGIEQARLDGIPCAKVIACVNHDPHAILSHQANHPDVLHFTEDIRTLDLAPLIAHTRECRHRNKSARLVLHASLECTNFSRAKGGQPRDPDSRTLADHLFRYIEALNPDYIQIENVEEFMCWGELDENGHPVSRYKGSDYQRWVHQVQTYGYDFDHRILNAADFGAYTSRKRFFAIFARKGLPIAFPVPTYSKNGGEDPLFGEVYKKWRPVREVLDLDDEGESIFCRKKPLVEKTLERIYAGLVKFVAGGKEDFLVRYNTVRPQGTVKFLSKQYSGHPMSKNKSIDEPAGTITTIPHEAFITAYYGNGFNTSIEMPANTIPTKDRMALVTSQFLDLQYGNGFPSSMESPSPTVTGNPKQNLVSADRFLMNPQFASAGGSIDKPCFTLIARMDKMPPYLVSTEQGYLAIIIHESDSPMIRIIKEFMALYGIIDIKMRMLNIKELKRIMGFPANYVLIGTQAEQKKYVGNAVEVNMSRVLCEALAAALPSSQQAAV